MNLGFNKISVRERENAPRYYYKVSHRVTCVERLQNALRSMLAFLFTQIGVCGLVTTYMVMGAFLFCHLEADSSMDRAEVAMKIRAGIQKFFHLAEYQNRFETKITKGNLSSRQRSRLLTWRNICLNWKIEREGILEMSIWKQECLFTDGFWLLSIMI